MLIKVQGQANALALFDVLSVRGVTWSEPTKKGDSWHTLYVKIAPEDWHKEKDFIKDCFPRMKISFN